MAEAFFFSYLEKTSLKKILNFIDKELEFNTLWRGLL